MTAKHERAGLDQGARVRALPILILLLAVAFIALWQGVHAIGLFSPIILPPPAAVFRDILLVGTNLATGGYMLAALRISMASKPGTEAVNQ